MLKYQMTFIWLKKFEILQAPIFLLCIFFNVTHSQVLRKSKSFLISNSPSTFYISLLGFRDSYNTYTHDYGLGAERVFEPINKIILKNKGKITIQNPRIIFNDKKNWYDIESHNSEIFLDNLTSKDKTLSIWKSFNDNRIHCASPDIRPNVCDPIKLLTYRGYMTCGYASDMITSYGRKFGFAGRVWHLSNNDGTTHAVPELKIDDKYVILDIDTQTFYLDYDNQTLIGKDEITSDKYLIYRTHHYGPSRSIDNNVASLYFGNVKLGTESNYYGHKANFQLRPGESIIYDYSKAELFHHVLSRRPNIIPWHISNSYIVYNLPNEKIFFDDLFFDYSNIDLIKNSNNETYICADNYKQKAFFIIKVSLPFLLLKAEALIDLEEGGEANLLSIDFSEDGNWWETVHFSEQGDRKTILIDMQNQFNLTSKSEILEYFLRFNLEPNQSQKLVKIYGCELKTTFQISKYFLPDIKLGDNKITYLQENSEDTEAEITIKYNEDFTNSPPEIITGHIYPPDNSITDNTQFTFKWNEAVDKENDKIIDYEFILSCDKNFKYPLSTQFHRRLNVIQDTLAPLFEIPMPGLLNSGEEYYWKVRAKDSLKVWSEWSDVWSFTAGGVMMPVDGFITVNGDDYKLIWEWNRKGDLPARYEIHGSNDDDGFIPADSTIIGYSFDTEFNIDKNDYKYYRICALDKNEYRSGPSKVFSEIITLTDDITVQDVGFVLSQNYPNPFNSSTTIKYNLPFKSDVKITIYDIMGRKVKSYEMQKLSLGTHATVWNGKNYQGEDVASGVYILRLKANSLDNKFKVIEKSIKLLLTK